VGGVLSERRGGGWLRGWRGVGGLAALSEYEVAPGGNVNINFEKVLNTVLSDCQVEYSNSAGSAVKSLAVFGFGLPIEKSEVRATTAR
jgi:hypothetical protein